jgi:hypothetical protein
MSPRISAGILFLVAFFALPLPMLVLEASVPAARFAQLGVVAAWLGLAEGSEGMVGIFAGLLLGHAFGYALVLAMVCALLRRYVLAPLHHRVRDHVTVIFSVLVISIASYGELYDTRFHHTSAHAKLLELYR